MENLLSNSTKIMVDVEGGNNMLYLPLDRLMQQSPALSNSSQESVRGIADAIINEVNNRAASGRARESR
jgi:membrane protease subunit HflK